MLLKKSERPLWMSPYSAATDFFLARVSAVVFSHAVKHNKYFAHDYSNPFTLLS